MPSELADAFLDAARAPLTRASERFSRLLMGDGVRALGEAELIAGVDEGVRAVASKAAVAPSAVETALPQAEIADLRARISQDQRTALSVIRRGELTVQPFGSLPARMSPSTHLVELAKLFARDKEIARSLESLAVNVAAWEEMLGACAGRIDTTPALLASMRRRVLLRRLVVAIVAGGGVALVAGGGIFAWRSHAEQVRKEQLAEEERRESAAAEKRIDDAVAAADPCAAGTIAAADRARATPQQIRKIGDRTALCEVEKKKAAEVARCDSIAKTLEAGQAPAIDDATADTKALLARIAARSLDPADLQVNDGSLPCATSKVGARIWGAYARAAVASSPLVWGKLDAVSPPVAALLAQSNLPDVAKRTVSFRAEKIATRALKTGAPADLEHGKSLCAFKVALGMKAGASCSKLK